MIWRWLESMNSFFNRIFSLFFSILLFIFLILFSLFFQNTISKKQVIFCTLTSKLIHSFSTSGFKPDLTIIDEVAQAMECVTYPALLQAPRVVLVGDQNQLCAILRSPEYGNKNFLKSIESLFSWSSVQAKNRYLVKSN